MSTLPFTAKGCFPLYFRYPETVTPIFDRLGFTPGFKRDHPSGLTFYIHRAKNKKESVPIGIIVPLLVKDTKEFIEKLKGLSLTITPYTWLNHPAFILELPEQKNLMVIQENHLLPEEIQYQGKQSKSALQGNGTFILNTKNPHKSADWYEEFLECETVYRSETLTITIMTNHGATSPSLTILHKLEKDTKKIGPLQYKNFCLTTKNIYECWHYLQNKNKLNPRWKNPQEDGIYRTVTLTSPDGYCWKIYGEVPFFNIHEAMKLTKQPKEKIEEAINKELLKALPEKYYKNIPIENQNPPYICEDNLLQFLWQKSPYQNQLKFL